MGWLTNLFNAFKSKEKIRVLINAVIDIAIKEAKQEIDKIDALSDEGKSEAKNGVDTLAAKLKSLINQGLE